MFLSYHFCNISEFCTLFSLLFLSFLSLLSSITLIHTPHTYHYLTEYHLKDKRFNFKSLEFSCLLTQHYSVKRIATLPQALSLATQEATWLKRLLSDITTGPSKPVTINEDNQGTIAVAKNPVSHARTKHIDNKYHYVREALQDGTIDLVYCPTENMIADIFTKPLSRNRFEMLRTEMGLVILQETK